MKTKAEIKLLKKGFHPSFVKNRKTRRSIKSNYGLNNFSKGYVMTILGIGRFITWLQRIDLGNGKFKIITQTKTV